MTASTYVPSAEFPTYAEFRKAKQREYRSAYKKRNPEKCQAAQIKRNKERYQTDAEYRLKLQGKGREAYRKNPEPTKRRSRETRAVKKEEFAAYDKLCYQANKPAIQAYKRVWMKANAASINRRTAARRALCAKATPSWADKKDIENAYMEARHMQMHVDHIVPLNHPLVCGLHVWENLQLLSPIENMRKNNRFDPETFHAD